MKNSTRENRKWNTGVGRKVITGKRQESTERKGKIEYKGKEYTREGNRKEDTEENVIEEYKSTGERRKESTEEKKESTRGI